MKNNIITIIAVLCTLVSCSQENEKQKINQVLDTWHKAAAEADFKTYFSKMTDKGVFLGTDATENWSNKEFREFSKPYFDKGKAWSFTSVERNVYIDANSEIAWFDELLDTQMKLCRGSGVLKKENRQWKIAHYVLSIAIPNDDVKEVIQLKKESDSLLTEKLRERY